MAMKLGNVQPKFVLGPFKVQTKISEVTLDIEIGEIYGSTFSGTRGRKIWEISAKLFSKQIPT